MLINSVQEAPATARLRRALQGDGLIRAPGVVDALSGLLVERAGFEAVHLTGSGLSRSMGYPDVGLLTMSEVVDRARSIARSVRIPVIADADEGYGNAINVMRTTLEFEAAGVAAIHIEDQSTPKRCGHYAGKRLIETKEMVGKIEAACAARHSREFIIIARTDAIATEGFASAIKRANAYREAGADVLFVEAPESRDQLKRLTEEISAPLMINMFSSIRTPVVGVSELRSLGYRIVIFPSHLQRATIKAIQRALALLQREDASAADDHELMVSLEEREELIGLNEIATLEKKYVV